MKINNQKLVIPKDGSKNLKRALAKAEHFNKREWCGAFTPSQIIELIDYGCKPHKSTSVEYYQDLIRKGESSQCWFYFTPKKERVTK